MTPCSPPPVVLLSPNVRLAELFDEHIPGNMIVTTLSFQGSLPFVGRRHWGFISDIHLTEHPSCQRFVVACAATPRVVLALTRERGKNTALRDALSSTDSVQCVELPCVESVPGPDRPALVEALRSRGWAWVVVTSPEAAAVLYRAWEDAERPSLRVAAVGDATADALRAHGFRVDFVPRKATGKSLVAEFDDPALPGEHVLYPASALASTDIQVGLAEKGYIVCRLNTYSTQTEKWNSEQMDKAIDVQIVTFAAPSAVKGWVQNAGVNKKVRVACIGETSRKAAISAGFSESQVFHPSKPGLKGWVSAVSDAVQDLDIERKHSSPFLQQ
jgi:uroporphyrinogen-III synthase